MHKRTLFMILSLSLLLFSLSFGVRLTTAQDTPAESTAEPQVPTEVPTEAPTEAPTEVPTEIPTEVPTEVPTEIPTEIPTEVPTEAPTEAPPEVTPEATQEPLPEATQEPTEPVLPLTPPVFTLAEDTVLMVVAGETLAFQVVAADDEGAVRVAVVTDTTAGMVNFQANPPVEVEPPYNTVVFVTYTAPAEFSGVDNFTLVAIDPSGGQAELALTVTVTLPVPSEESVVPTPNLMGEPVERIIKYNPAASEESITAMLQSLGAVELDRLPSIGALRVMIPETLGTTQAAVAAVSSDIRAQSAGIQAIEQNIEYHITGYTPNDPYLSNQWALDDTYVHSTSGIGAWDMNTRRGSGIIVAVVDTGVDLQHPEFAGKLVTGWDFVNDDNNPDDDHSHGTHVAGVIAAKTNNGIGIAGIAYNARIMPVKVCDYSGGCGTWEIAAGIVYAVDRRVNVINMSLGGASVQQTIEAAVQFAIASDVVVVASAGNTGSVPGSYSYPASYPGVISVAAHQSDGGSAGDLYGYYTNDRITVSAPGIDIFSTVPLEYGSYQGGWNGTSMAAPHVSGIVALIMSANVARTPQQVKEALICSAWDMGTAGYDTSYGWGIVQADWAMNWFNNSASCKVSQPNDNFEDATVLRRVPTNPVIIQPIHTRSVTAYTSDPTICGYTPQQTLWYRLVAPRSAVYQFSTFGSSYDTVLGVYQGMPGALTEVGCNDDLGPTLQSVASIGLTARQTYYIAVGSLSGTINDGLLNFDVRYALPVPTRTSRAQQENNASVSYRGSWNVMTYRGASGNRVMETYDNSATAIFTFQGNTLQLSRTIGPTQGSLEVWVDGALLSTISNRAAQNAYNQLYNLGVGGYSNAWHTAVLRRASGGPSGPVDIDTINPQDGLSQNLTPIRGVADSLDTRGTYLAYYNNWANVTNAAAYRGTLTTTTDDTAFLLARALGDTISIYRSTGPGYGSMDVYLDGQFYATVDNTTSTGVSVPYTITGLSPTDHTIEILNNETAPGVGAPLTIDKIAVSTMRVMAFNRNTDDRVAASYGFTGLWTLVSDTSAYARTISRTSDPAARAAFRFNGNWVCIGYTAQPGGGSMDLYVDNVYQGTINSSSVGTYYQSYWCSTLFADQAHFVELVYAGGGIFDLDFVNPRQYRTITFDRRVVQESDASITRNNPSNWFTSGIVASAGGFRPNGGRQIWSNTIGSSVDFWINGTGFILYTSVGPTMGDWEVYVDGAYFTTIELTSWRWRPMAYGITNLGPGFHNIELVAINTSPGYNVYFDGVRAFP